MTDLDLGTPMDAGRRRRWSRRVKSATVHPLLHRSDALFAESPVVLDVNAPTSKKNNRRIFRRPDGGICLVPSRKAVLGEKRVASAARDAVPFGQRPLFPDQDVAVEITYHARTERATVRVVPLRARPAKFTGRKRDLHSVIDCIMDGMQGTVFRDDRQVAFISVERRLD